jgi:hypothetical protein
MATFTCSICGATCASAEAFAAHLNEIRRRRELYGASWGLAAKRYSPRATDRYDRERDDEVA